jgi:predicted DNA-binding transcriptional regulator AlpA
MDAEIELWNKDAVLKFFGGIHTATLYRGMQDGLYSKPINIGRSAVRWIASECRGARDRMIAARGGRPPSKRGRPPKAVPQPTAEPDEPSAEPKQSTGPARRRAVAR